MDVAGLCSECGAPGVLHGCDLCGAMVHRQCEAGHNRHVHGSGGGGPGGGGSGGPDWGETEVVS